MKRTLFGLLAATALAVTACGDSDPTASEPSGTTSTDTISVSSANFTENILLANIYVEALNAKGVKATLRPPIGERVTYVKAMERGEFDLIPEYSGSLLSYLDKNATLTESSAVYSELKSKLPATLEVLEQSAAEDKDGVVVTKETAATYNLTSIADLAPHAPKLVFGGPAQFKTRADGIPGLEKNYGVKFKEFKALDVGGPLTVAALKNGQVQAADLFTTDPAIVTNGFVVLADPKSQFGAQNVVPLINKAKASDKVKETLNAVSKKLTTENLTKLVAEVAVDKKDVNAVAKAWLSANGLI